MIDLPQQQLVPIPYTILTKVASDSNVVKGGSFGTVIGFAAGTAGLMLASRRYQTIRNLTLPMKAFLTTSAGTFVGIIAADHASRDFEKQQNAISMWYENREGRLHAEELRNMTFTDRALAFAAREKYKIVGATWMASMFGSFILVSRSPHLSGPQKIVQARVYAQGLTLAVLCASAAFEISDQRRGRGLLSKDKKQEEDVDEPKPAHTEGDLWKDMVAAEEERLKSKHQSLHVKHTPHHKTAETKSEASESSEAESNDEKEE